MKNCLYEAKKYNNIREILEDAIEKYSDHIAFTIKHKDDKKVEYENITYTDFGNDLKYLGTGLISLGLKDKRVAVISKNRYEWAVSYFSVVCGVGIVVPLDKGLPEQEIETSLQRSGAEAVIFEEKYCDIMRNIKENNNTKVKQFICMDNVEDKDFIEYKNIIKNGKKLIEEGNTEYANTKIDDEKMSIILFTSGTTSLAKAVMLSHKNIASNIYQMNCAEKLYDTDVNIALLPFHHTFGSTGILMMLCNGVKNVFCDGLRHIQENFKEYKVSVFVSVPLILESIHKKIMKTIEKQGKLKQVEFGKKISKFLLKFGIDIRRKIFKEILDNLGGNMRFVVCGAAPLDKQVEEDLNAFGILTIQGYGLTETSPVVCAENEKSLKFGSCGYPLVDVEVKIDEPNKEGIGEVIIKGPNVMLGYFENEEATKEALVNGWYHSGDLGYIDKQGYVYITGRKKNVIVLKNGKNIYPEEIEVLINNLIYVKESMVFGYPKDEDLIVSAKIVYDKDYMSKNYKDFNEEDIRNKIWKDIKEINSTLTNYKHIKKIIVTDEEMIKTTTAKIKRFKEIENIIKEDILK